MHEEMQQFLQVFLQEANEQIDLLEQDILRLEQEVAPELLQEIFRAAHTLKGGARAMGYQAMAELTHAMEDLFDLLRNGQIEVSSALVDALFHSLDALKEMLQEIAATGTTQQDCTAITARLRGVISPNPPIPSAPSESLQKVSPSPLSAGVLEACRQAIATGQTIHRLEVELAPDSVLRSVRAQMVLHTLERMGSVLHTEPAEEALENEQFETQFAVLVASYHPEERLRDEVEGLSEIKAVRVSPCSLETLSLQPPPEVSEEKSRNEAPVSAQKGPAKAEGSKGASVQQQTVRVDVSRLDTLMNLIGELVIDRTRIAQLCSRIEEKLGTDSTVEHLHEVSVHIARITDQLQDEVMKARMLPIDNVFNRFPRMMRDLAKRLGKEFQFEIEGRETELDRSVIEAIGDPLIHMLRNSVDHGIEFPEEREQAGKPRSGTVWLRARHQENHIVIEVEDDGRGIDPAKMREIAVEKNLLSPDAAARLSEREAINLIFASGFSTAKQVTDVSGRGVGMDIVRSNLQKLGATVDIESWVGRGTRFTVRLPLTLAIIRSLLVYVGSSVYALPLNTVSETLRVDVRQVQSVRRQPTILLRGESLNLAPLGALLPLEGGTRKQYREDSESYLTGKTKFATHAVVQEGALTPHFQQPKGLNVVVVGTEKNRLGLIVDGFIGEQEIVIKTLGKFIGDIQGVSGATILGDGRMALILDAEGLLSLAMRRKGVFSHAA